MQEYIERSISFDEYTAQIDQLLQEGKISGPNQTDALIGFTKLNRVRMQRLEKTIELDEDVRSYVASAGVDWIWLIITEGWCGDAAQNIPIIEKLAAANPGIETRYILRDEYPELIESFLTGGSRSIPKLISIDRASGHVLGTWGARPQKAQALFEKLKAEGLDKPAIMESLQRWYFADRGRSLQAEFVELLRQWSRTPLARAA